MDHKTLFITEIISYLKSFANDTQIWSFIRHDCVDPLASILINKLYPWMIFTYSLFVLTFLSVIVILIIIIKK